MADEAVYRAAFLRMHPTGKAVLSLTEASTGEEAALAQIAAGELGIPPEDIKVLHEDELRFGEGHSFNTKPSDVVGDNVAITAAKLRDKAQLIAAPMLDSSPGMLKWDNGEFSVGGKSVKIQAVAHRAFGTGELPEGVEGSMDAQTTYKAEAA